MGGRTHFSGALAPPIAVRIPSTSDISAIACSHSRDPEYCHDCADARWRSTEDSHAIFVRPPGTPRHPMGSLNGVSPTCTQGEEPLYGDAVTPSGRIRGYLVDEESDKENYEDAARVSRVRKDAKGVEDGRD